ncbi:hypothetical protein PROFUN_03202 [Planoprotostelium fungivorum]|uniref:2-oxo-4-hydroxy-4-carboxy-5-ureidoimidazoline decarboxylase n=1 Tax=Planoprotostelium fungivorum TaxID=1890364 RepID=A0A2P6NWY8_9EUKA|nr:hypothetical protein PROFUN_03202 [Planoprotostelium fungivorum]
MSSNQLPPIDVLNSSSPSEFLHAVNILFETAPPLSKSLLSSRPFSSYKDIICKAEETIKTLDDKDRLEVINAHPRIGEAGKLSTMSQSEQHGEKEKSMTRDRLDAVDAELQDLNRCYEEQYGFRFVIFKGEKSKEEVIPILKQRLASNDKHAEMEIGLREMIQIARARLQRLSKL